MSLAPVPAWDEFTEVEFAFQFVRDALEDGNDKLKKGAPANPRRMEQLRTEILSLGLLLGDSRNLCEGLMIEHDQEKLIG